MSGARPPSTQEQRTDAARKALIRATIEVLANEGYRRTTFTRIQEVAGLSRGLINYHFGTKLSLIESVVLHIRSDFMQVVRDLDSSERSGYERVRHMVGLYCERLARDPATAKVMLILGTESLGENDVIRSVMQEAYLWLREELRHRIDQGIEDGSIRSDVDSGGYAAVVEAIIRGLVLQYLVDPDEVDLPSVTDAALDCVSALVPTPSGPPEPR